MTFKVFLYEEYVCTCVNVLHVCDVCVCVLVHAPEEGSKCSPLSLSTSTRLEARESPAILLSTPHSVLGLPGNVDHTQFVMWLFGYLNKNSSPVSAVNNS